jgi:hypothetical protein
MLVAGCEMLVKERGLEGRRLTSGIRLQTSASLRYGYLFFELLLFVKLGVVAVTSEEFVVGAKFGDASGYQDCYLVRVSGS